MGTGVKGGPAEGAHRAFRSGLLAVWKILGSFPRRKLLIWLLIAYLSQSAWLVPIRFLEGERWRLFPGRVAGIARCGDGVLVASETRAWAFDRELRTLRFSLNLARIFSGARVRSLSAAEYWEDGVLYLLVGLGESEHRRVVVDTATNRLVLQDGIAGDWYQQEFRRIPSGFVAFELDPGASRAVWYDSAGSAGWVSRVGGTRLLPAPHDNGRLLQPGLRRSIRACGNGPAFLILGSGSWADACLRRASLPFPELPAGEHRVPHDASAAGW